MPVHYAGNVGNLDEIYKFAKKFNVRVIEDAAYSLVQSLSFSSQEI